MNASFRVLIRLNTDMTRTTFCSYYSFITYSNWIYFDSKREFPLSYYEFKMDLHTNRDRAEKRKSFIYNFILFFQLDYYVDFGMCLNNSYKLSKVMFLKFSRWDFASSEHMVFVLY